MAWWTWALIGGGIAAAAVATAALVAALRSARAAERRATDAAHELVRMTDDLERRIHDVREQTANAEHRIQIVDESRHAAARARDELDEPDEPA